MEKQSWLETAEYVFLAGSALGTAIAVASGQVAFAAVPLTVALALNFVNRRQIQQQTRQSSRNALSETHQIIQSLQQQVGALPAINSQLNTLTQQVNARSETQAIVPLQHAIAQLREQFNSIASHHDNLPTSQGADSSEVEVAIIHLRDQLDALHQQFYTRSETQAIEQLEAALTQQREQLTSLTERLDHSPMPQGIDLSSVESAVTHLNEQLNALHQQLNTRPETQSIEQLEAALAEQREQLDTIASHLENSSIPQAFELSAVESAITHLNGQLDSLHQQFNARSEAQTIEQLEEALAQQREQLIGLAERLDNSPAPQAVDLSEIDSIITHLNGQLDSLHQQFNARPETQAVEQLEAALVEQREQLTVLAERLEYSPTQQAVDLSEIESIITHLNGQLDALHQQFNARPETQAIEQLESALAQYKEEWNALASRLDNLPTAEDADLSGVEQVISLLNGQLEALTLRVDNLPTAQDADLSWVEAAIALLNDQVEALTLRVDNLPTAQDADLSWVEAAIAQIHEQLDAQSQQFNARLEVQAIEHLEEVSTQIRQQVNAVVLRLDHLHTPQEIDLSEIESAIAQVNGQVEALTSRFESLPTPQDVDLSEVESAIALLNGQVEALTSRFESLPTPQDADLSEVESAIALLNGQVEALTSRFESLATPQDVDLSEVESAIADINTQLDALSQQLNVRSETQTIEQVEGAIAQLQEQLNAVVLRLDHLPTSAEVDLSPVEQAIADINSQLNDLKQAFNDRPETRSIEQLESISLHLAEQLNAIVLSLDEQSTLQALNFTEEEEAIADDSNLPETLVLAQDSQVPTQDSQPTPSAVDVSGQEQASTEISSQLDALIQQLNARPQTQAIKQVERVITLLTDQLNTIALRLSNLPAPQELDLSGVEQAIIHIHSQVDELKQQFHERPEIEAIEQLEGAIAQIRESADTEDEEVIADINFQLSAITLCLDNLPHFPEIEISGVEQAVLEIDTQVDALAQNLFENSRTSSAVELNQDNHKDAIADINARLEALSQPFKPQEELPTIEQLERAVVHLSAQLNDLTVSLENLPTSSDLDFGEEEDEIANLQW